MSGRRFLSELDRLGVELRANGDRLRYAGSEEAITPELLDRIKNHKEELLTLLVWREDEACKLIKDALAYLNERYLDCGKPDFDSSALNPYEDAVDEAYGARDMGRLRRTVRAFVMAGLEKFRRGRRTA